MDVTGRVVVVGAGHNGLVCAIRLASAGLDVQVLEQAPVPGGAVVSAEDTLPGFVHDVCAGFFPMTMASAVLRDLPPVRNVEWVDPPVGMAHPFLDGSGIALHRDPAATAASLDAVAAGTGRAWSDLVERVAPHRELLWRTAMGPFPPLAPAARLVGALRTDAARLAVMLATGAGGMGRRLFGDDRAAAWLAGSISHSDVGPESPAGAMLAFGLAMMGQLVGWQFPRGGAGRLTEALAGHVRELGGTVRCGAAVEAIELRGGRVAGVRLRDGEQVPRRRSSPRSARGPSWRCCRPAQSTACSNGGCVAGATASGRSSSTWPSMAPFPGRTPRRARPVSSISPTPSTTWRRARARRGRGAFRTPR